MIKIKFLSIIIRLKTLIANDNSRFFLFFLVIFNKTLGRQPKNPGLFFFVFVLNPGGQLKKIPPTKNGKRTKKPKEHQRKPKKSEEEQGRTREKKDERRRTKRSKEEQKRAKNNIEAQRRTQKNKEKEK